MNANWKTRMAGNVPMTYLTAKAREFRSIVYETIADFPEPLTGRLAVHLELIPPTRHKLDIDNFCKGTIDALMHAGVFVDDEQIDKLIVERRHVEAPGCCDVTITELP